ncbi:uncharacterized protein LOC108109462 [Drosophila eugracilis]|uniref:uncharacterized protein LOC108109462 n=1 Tax=Drosophila eugracilis TaxID=29029 RepID=UPI001BDA151E|nr:uncharacterized protein LOC108109462 [Drosophila eugracilis]
METLITCDVCLKNVSFVEFETHYKYCVGQRNAFDIIMGKSTMNSQNQILLSKEADNNKRCIPSDMEMRHILTDKQRVSAASDIQNSANISEIPMQSNFPIKTFRVYAKNREIVLQDVINQCDNDILKVLIFCLGEYRSIKFNLKVHGLYAKEDEEGECGETVKAFTTPYKSAYETRSLVKELVDTLDYIRSSVIEFQYRNYDLLIKGFNFIEITAIKLEHIPAAGFVSAPKAIKCKNALINVKNKDNFCFKWSILASIALIRHNNKSFQNVGKKKQERERLNSPLHYRGVDISQDVIIYDGIRLDFTGIVFPIQLEGIKRFESNNNEFSINVYEVGDDGKSIVGPTIRAQKTRSRHINLLALNNCYEQTMHHAFITNMKRLCFSQHSKAHNSPGFCENCLQFYPLKTNKQHNCDYVSTIYPEPNTKLSFKSSSKCISPPIVIYADIESSLESISSEAWAASFYIVHYYEPRLNEMHTFDGSDCIKKFCQALKDKLRGLYYKYWKFQKRNHDSVDEESERLGKCAVCGEEISECSLDMLFHQFAGFYLGPVHVACKTKHRLNYSFFPVVFNNLTRFDINLLIREMGREVKPIPSNQDLYTMLILNCSINGQDRFQIKFLDSNNFFSYNIDKLISSMNDNSFENLRKRYKDMKFELMCLKKVYLQNAESLDQLDNIVLPENMFSNCQDYINADQVWHTFNCQNIRDYLKVYLERDVTILADVFEDFRRLCITTYGLDPMNYVTAPSMAWDAMLKVTEVNLDLISDPEMLNFLQNAVRGGLVKCNQENATANNEYLDNFDPREPTNYLASIEANNLSEWAMSQPLPYSNFTFLNDNEIEELDIKEHPSDGDVGYILQVDLKYPSYLHGSHSSMPFCPENQVLPGGNHQQVIAKITDKTDYIIHLKHLQLCLEHGLILTKIHRVLSFNQTAWLKPYIDFNMNHMELAKNEFERQFLKSMNSFIIGKALENVEKRCDITVVTHYQSRQNSPGFRQRVARNNFRGVEIFPNNLAAIQSVKSKITYDKPLYIGVTVLELSKWFMYEHYYNFLSVKCPSSKILLINKNLFVASLREDFYKLVEENPQRFDTSNYIVNGQNNDVNLMQDKYAAQAIKEIKGKRVYLRKYS